MRPRFLFVFCVLGNMLYAQLPFSSFSFNCTKDTFVSCGASCLDLKVKVPVINAYTDQYRVQKEGCFRPNVSPAAPGSGTSFSVDDRYSPVIPLPFDFYFFGAGYVQTVFSTNGTISFDLTNTGRSAQWTIQGLAGSLPSTDYDRAVIMAPFHDIDISRPESPNRQIKYDVTGTMPHRKWILTFYKVPCYDCNNLIENTYQVSLYEGLSLVEIHIFSRQVCTTWNAGAAMVGMQSFDRDKGIMAPGRSAFTNPRWGGVNMNEAWLFTPASGPSLLKKVELYKSTGEFVALGDTLNDGNGNYNVTFNSLCPDSNTTKYIVKSSYYNNEYPFQYPAADSIIYATDTVNVVLLSGNNPLLEVQNACPGYSNGRITVTDPVAAGFQYSLNGSAYQSSPVFDFLPHGTYMVSIKNGESGCILEKAVEVNEGYRQNTHINYVRSIYCNTEAVSPAPFINGVAGGVFSASPSGLNINSNTGTINVAASDTGNYTITYHINSNDSCLNPVATTNVRVVNNTQFVWTGMIDSNWENPFNWSCNNLPNSTSDVYIYSGNVVISSNVLVNKLTVFPGVNLTVSPGYNLTISNPGP